MKAIKNLSTTISLILLSALCICTAPLNGMDIGRGIRREKSLAQQGLLEKVWVKTADKVISLPKWEIDQMKALQMLYVAQKGTNSETNPIDISTITIDELGPDGKTMVRTAITSDKMALVKMALKKAINAEIFENFCDNLAPKDKNDLINVTFSLQAMGLAALLANEFFPPEVQEKLGAIYPNLTGATIIEPVLRYIQNAQKTILHGHKDTVTCVAYSPDGNYIVSGSSDRNLILWDAKTGEEIKTLTGHQSSVSCVAYSPDGKYIVSGSWDENLILRDSKTGELIKRLQGHQSMVTCLAYSPDGKHIVSGSRDGNLIQWNAKTGEQINVQDYQAFINCVAYSPDGKYIVSGSSDGNLILRDGKTGNQIKMLQGHTGAVTCVAYSPDGNYIISGAWDKNLILWNAKTGEQIQTLHGHQGYILCVAFSPDGNYIVSGSSNGNLILWNAKTGEQVQILQGHQAFIKCVAYSPDGKYIVLGSSEGNLILWKLCDQDALDFIATKLTLAQARFLYRLYIAKLNAITVQLNLNDPDYAIYTGLPNDIKTLIKTYFLLQLPAPIKQTSYARTKKSIKAPQKVEESASLTKAVQEKTEYYRTFFSKVSSKSIAEKIAIIKQTMSNLDKDSVDYKACQNVLDELEHEPF